MCGLASIISAGAPVSPAALKNATDALYHRGPDGDGFWFSADGRVGLGHRRLSIIDLATGTQPISNEDNSIHIIVNGEFYDFERQREELKRLGHRFRTASDSEVALHLYKQYGLDFVQHLRGEFALIIYDETKKRMVAARDRFGIKPLCYARDKSGTLYLASEAKAIFAAGFKSAWDHAAFYTACSMQYTPTDRTLFDGVSQLLPGHMLVFENQHLNLKKYWDLDYPTTHAERSDEEWIETFREEFETAVRLRLRADVPICFHLSGGIDSSAVAATAAKIHGNAFDCFTVRFDHEAYDEFKIASEMAAKMGSRLHQVPVSTEDMVHYIPDAVYYSEGLSINGHLVGKFLLSRAIRAAGFKVALTGEGADEVLAGYPHFRDDLIGDDAAKRQTLYQSNDKLAGLFLSHGDTLGTNRISDALGFLPSFLKAKASLGLRVHGVLSQDFLHENAKRDIYGEFISSVDVKGQLTQREAVDQSSYLWTKTALATYILRTLGDGCEMANSVEGRLPFLDHKLFELVRQMPMHLKIRDMTEKFVLREALRPLLTDTLYKRQKHPFIAPPVSTTLDVFIQDTLRSTAFARLPFFDGMKVRGWLDSLPGMPPPDRIAAEPVLMMMLTSFFIGQKFNLSEHA